MQSNKVTYKVASSKYSCVERRGRIFFLSLHKTKITNFELTWVIAKDTLRILIVSLVIDYTGIY